ncbi:hypothetical protein BDV96DRAFT_693535, partial [Lophiotrema nucula]
MLHRSLSSRREQAALAISHIKTPFLILSDDHTLWRATSNFLPSLLAPFSNPRVGAVGPVLQARHYHHRLFSFCGFWNFIGMAYLTRRAHEFLATNTIDGGLSCLSSRFVLFRSAIYTDPDFLHAYLNEYTFWGRVGPLNADDDKFHTRWLTTHGWEIKTQYGKDCVMETELAVSEKCRVLPGICGVRVSLLVPQGLRTLHLLEVFWSTASTAKKSPRIKDNTSVGWGNGKASSSLLRAFEKLPVRRMTSKKSTV